MDPMTDSLREAISNMDITNDQGRSSGNGFLAPPWKDITQFLDEATDDFQVGQLVHLQSFTLFDAMSAIEIMDPKMDTGMVLDGDDNTSQTFDINRALDPGELLWIMDRLLSCEMAWISGHSLAQTVYTSTYFHHIRELASEQYEKSSESTIRNALKAYLLGSVKCCQHIFNEMSACNVYEEEDFTTNLFGLSLYEQYTDSMVMNEIDTSLMELRELVDKANPNGLSTHSAAELAPLYNRLYMRKSYLLGLIYVSHTQCSYLSHAKAEFENILQLLNVKEDQLSISATISKGKVVEGAFDPSINRKLTAQAPPRPITLPSDEESYGHFQELIGRLISICGVTQYPSIVSLLNYFKSFGAKQPPPDAFSRSKLNSLLYHDSRVFGTDSVVNFVSLAIDELVRPPRWILFPGSIRVPEHVSSSPLLDETRKALSEFLERAALPFIDYFKIQCHNRSRQRRIMCKVLNEWEMLQDEAAVIDEKIQNLAHFDSPQNYFSSWAYLVKLEMMETIVLLGFELELYGSNEYVMMYLYLIEVLKAQELLLEHVQTQIVLQRNEASNVDKKGKGRKIPQETTASFDHAIQCVQSQRYQNEAQIRMASGICNLLLAVIYETHQLDLLKPRFDDEATRFRQRTKPFLGIASPPQPTVEAIAKTIETNASLDKNDILAHLQAALKKIEMVNNMSTEQTRTEMCRDSFNQDMAGMKRTCLGNIITIKKLSDEKNNSTKVDVTFRYHPSWPVIELK
ncbi:Mak10 subunit, NatC N-terminal acetyltransferase-domain-containing protein [Zychaea mexicana]|uniref:Mak10 subunit, NatC N-terminal acetyltransferase-domain-containing protein n=1 Tax=Zychaea mexicana TaxID=64656 RepID=UPI0022FEDAE1|nr:Mak10 subunit, NatC N-terminal acetyltransferase-domain-containing protein [Zychaea mexicana]KAI9468681.1 Mak10 subunit, NatC N-terminal acetyltransferase-domain-containing protein [Zychaea mexicana]